MGRHKTNDVARAMETWLIDNHIVSVGTAENYASELRTFVSALPNKWQDIVNEEAVSAAAHHMWASDPKRFRKVRPAWAKLVRWAKARNVVVPPLPKPQKVKSGEVDLPEDVLRVVHYLSSRRIFSLKLLTRMIWADEGKHTGGMVEVRDPTQRNTWMLVPEGMVETLRNYSPPEDLTCPLIPKAPGSRDPYTARGLENEMARYRRNYEVQEVDPLDELIARNRAAYGDGSALGAAPKKVEGPTVGNIVLEGRPAPVTSANYTSEWKKDGPVDGDLAAALGWDPDAID